MATNEVQIVVKGKDLASNTLNKVGKGLKKVGDEVDDTQKSFKGLGTALTAIGSAITVSKLFDLGKQAAAAQDAARGFERAFGNVEQGLQSLRIASRGTISDLDLMQSATKAAALGVTTDVGELSELLEIAALRGRELGVSTTQAFSDIVTGIGRQSPLILDNLGIITKGWAELAKEQGVAFDQQFILNRVMEDGQQILKDYASVTDTSSERIARMQASLTNMSTKVGEIVLPVLSSLADAVVAIIDTVNQASLAIEKLISNEQRLRGEASVITSRSEDARFRVLDELAAAGAGQFRQSVQAGQASAVEAVRAARQSGLVTPTGGGQFTINVNAVSNANPQEIANSITRNFRTFAGGTGAGAFAPT